MREIKFRGKEIEDGKWLYGDFVHQDKFNRAMIKQDNYSACVDENTLGQFTGLYDKNKVPIYEGDIVIVETYDYDEPAWSGDFYIEYSNILSSFIFQNLEDKSDYKGMREILSYYNYDIEVIGNIYENPDLLGE